MLEIPASNGGAYREYLVSHETLQERPRLRLPVCGETAVPSLFQPTLARSFHPPRSSSSLSLSLFRSPFINCNKPREGAGGNKPLKNPIIANPLHLFCFHLTCRRVRLTSNQVYLEYRCLEYRGVLWSQQPVCNRSFSISLEKVNKLKVVIVVQTL